MLLNQISQFYYTYFYAKTEINIVLDQLKIKFYAPCTSNVSIQEFANIIVKKWENEHGTFSII